MAILPVPRMKHTVAAEVEKRCPTFLWFFSSLSFLSFLSSLSSVFTRVKVNNAVSSVGTGKLRFPGKGSTPILVADADMIGSPIGCRTYDTLLTLQPRFQVANV